MSGIFLFFTHTRTLGSVSNAEGSTAAMMKHAPMNPIVSVMAAAIGMLYAQMLSMALVVGIYFVTFQPVMIQNPVGTLGMIMLAWSGGLGIGLIFRAFRPWQPELMTFATTIFMRANMVPLGKIFVANELPPKIRGDFDWNPLFHTIDRCRGYVFENYNPHFTCYMYPVYVTLACLMFGLIAEFYTREHASLGWEMGR